MIKRSIASKSSTSLADFLPVGGLLSAPAFVLVLFLAAVLRFLVDGEVRGAGPLLFENDGADGGGEIDNWSN